MSAELLRRPDGWYARFKDGGKAGYGPVRGPFKRDRLDVPANAPLSVAKAALARWEAAHAEE